MRVKMMIVLGFGAMMLFPGAGSAQEPWPERREEWRDRCLEIREHLARARHEESHDAAEGEPREAREDRQRIKRERREYRKHRCEEILR